MRTHSTEAGRLVFVGAASRVSDGRGRRGKNVEGKQLGNREVEAETLLVHGPAGQKQPAMRADWSKGLHCRWSQGSYLQFEEYRSRSKRL